MKKSACILCASLLAVNLCSCSGASNSQPKTTVAATTAQTTTAQVTTKRATTAPPITAPVTTEQPTTVQPTTAEPTTEQPTTEQTTAVEEGEYERLSTIDGSQNGLLTISNVSDSGFDFIAEASTSGYVPNIGKVVGTADKISDTEYKFTDTKHPEYGYEMTFTVENGDSITVDEKINEGKQNPYAGVGVHFYGTYEK